MNKGKKRIVMCHTVISSRREQLMGSCTVLRYSKSALAPHSSDASAPASRDSQVKTGAEDVNLSENFWQYLQK